MGVIVITVPEKVDIKLKANNLEEAIKLLKEKLEEQKKITLAQYFLKKYGGKLPVDVKDKNC